ncbi:MAG: sulfatase [Sedimentisphaeraceae bacterium JB056]
MNRRDFIESFAGTSLAAASTAFAAAQGGSTEKSSMPKFANQSSVRHKKPNVLILMTDQQRPDSLGCYGSKIAKTPNIDSLANGGVLFENCYVQNPLCCPSRYTMLTGQYPHSHGVMSNWYKPREGLKSFAHVLGSAGYQSAAIGKMHLTPWYDNFGFDGRIIAEPKMEVGHQDDYGTFINKHGYTREQMYPWNDKFLKQCTAIDSNVPAELHIDSFVGKSVCEYLNRIDEDIPFCCMGSFVSPHNPYDPPEPYNKLFKDTKFPPKNMGKDEINEKPREAYDYINEVLSADWGVTTDKFSDEQLHRIKANYYGLNTLIDDWIGKIIDTLKEKGIYDNTIIIYTSDHGDLLGDHGLIFKQCFYEQSVKVPLIIHAPAYFESGRVNDLVELKDIYSTVCEMGSARPGKEAQSKSLMPLLKREKGYVHNDAVFSENYFGKMIRTGPWKLVYYIGKDYGELYNLDKDPLEQDNLWDKKSYADIKSELKSRLLDWMAISQKSLYFPVRDKHHDISYAEYVQSDGRAKKVDVQPWFLNGFEDLYEKWDFTTTLNKTI